MSALASMRIASTSCCLVSSGFTSASLDLPDLPDLRDLPDLLGLPDLRDLATRPYAPFLPDLPPPTPPPCPPRPTRPSRPTRPTRPTRPARPTRPTRPTRLCSRALCLTRAPAGKPDKTHFHGMTDTWMAPGAPCPPTDLMA